MERVYIEGKKGLVVSRTVNPFPEDPDERLAAILSCVNTEPKNIVLAFCLDEDSKTSWELKEAFERYVGSGHWAPIHPAFSGYSHKTFVPVGAVEEEIISSPYEIPVSHFRLTKAGMRYAKPIAAFALRFAVEHGRSIYEYLGKTSTTGDTRSPQNRVKLLEALKEGNKREVDLVSSTGLGEDNVIRHILALEKLGLVEYDSANPEERYVWYRWERGKRPTDVSAYKGRPTLTRKVAEALRRLKKANARMIAEELGLRLTNDISGVLSHFAKEGFSQRERWTGKEFQSQATLLEDGRAFLDEFVNPTKAALEGKLGPEEFLDFYDERKAKEYAEAAMDLYEKASPFRKAKSAEIRRYEVLDFIRGKNEIGEVPRAREICEHFWGNFVIKYLRQLVEEGKLRKEREGPAVRYYAI